MDHIPDASGIVMHGHYYKVSRLETGIVHVIKLRDTVLFKSDRIFQNTENLIHNH